MRAYADLDRQTPQRQLIRWIERVVDPDVEGFLGGQTEQGTVTPNRGQELGDGSLELLPELRIVRFEDRAADALRDGGLQKQEQAADVDVLPVGIDAGSRRSGAPHGRPAPRPEDPNHIDAVVEVEVTLITVAQHSLQSLSSGDRGFLTGGCLVHAAAGVDAREDAGHMA